MEPKLGHPWPTIHPTHIEVTSIHQRALQNVALEIIVSKYILVTTKLYRKLILQKYV